MLGIKNTDVNMADMVSVLRELTIYRFYSCQSEIHINPRNMINRGKIKFSPQNHF